MSQPSLSQPCSPPAGAATSRSFLDPGLAECMERDGYVVLPVLDADSIREVMAIYCGAGVTFEQGWHTDMYSANLDYRRATHEQVGKIFADRILPLLNGFRFCCGNFVVKEPHIENTVPLHQDWTIIEHDQSRSLNVICAMIDVPPDHGQLRVLPGSHHAPKRVSFGPVDHLQIAHLLPLIEKQYVVRLQQRAGEALIYDGRLLHASDRNRSDRVRVCYSASFVPQESPLRHYYKDPQAPDVLEEYEIDSDFFWKHKLGERPQEGKLVRAMPHVDSPITEQHLVLWNRARLTSPS